MHKRLVQCEIMKSISIWIMGHTKVTIVFFIIHCCYTRVNLLHFQGWECYYESNLPFLTQFHLSLFVNEKTQNKSEWVSIYTVQFLSQHANCQYILVSHHDQVVAAERKKFQSSSEKDTKLKDKQYILSLSL